MTPEQKIKAQRIIERQVKMSSATLDALRRAGLTDERQIQIEFFFDAPSETSARP